MKTKYLLLILLVCGCAPSNSLWVSTTDDMVGTRLGQHYWGEMCESECLNKLWAPSSTNKNIFDKTLVEGDGFRYFVTWIPGCQYSLLVSDEGIIQSWRYEAADVNKCIIW
jgi:phage terminase large subunit GpA-like protein